MFKVTTMCSLAFQFGRRSKFVNFGRFFEATTSSVGNLSHPAPIFAHAAPPDTNRIFWSPKAYFLSCSKRPVFVEALLLDLLELCGDGLDAKVIGAGRQCGVFGREPLVQTASSGVGMRSSIIIRRASARQRPTVLTPNWSLLAKFDGEFPSGAQIYAGSGTLYTW
jgi:hypothetical protein